MGSSVNCETPTPEFLQAFVARAHGADVLRFDAYVDLALYDPVVGYYRRQRSRIGTAPGTDFFTATSAGRGVFGELICAASVKALGERDPRHHEFIEIGAESPAGVLTGVAHPFRDVRTIRIGDPIELSGDCVVFSNELFDAQPFRRFQFRRREWCELGVRIRDGRLEEVHLPVGEPLPFVLPTPVFEGYTIDAPIAATVLAERIVAQRWRGLFIACDYGKSWQELAEATPGGTARSYFQHTQGSNLLARPGEQDLTCHLCWDWLTRAVRDHGFSFLELESQEGFFIHHADAYIAPAIAADAARFTTRKQALLQILHGAHMGQKFQVLYGLR